MSNAHTTPVPSTEALEELVSPKARNRKSLFALIDTAVAVAFWAVVIVLVGLATILSFNLGEWHPSFWVGLFVPVIVAVLIYAMWWVSHPVTGKWLGFSIGVVDLVVGIAVLVLLFVLPGETFQFDKFGWGILVAGILGSALVAIKIYGLISRKVSKKLT